MMMGGTFDHWWPDQDTDTAEALVRCARLAAQGIAEKLAEALAQSPELNEERWKLLVQAASRNAIMEVTDSGPLVRLADNESFVAAVAECTAGTAAPGGSDWARAIEVRKEQRMRRQLEAMKLPPSEINKLTQQQRSQRKP